MVIYKPGTSHFTANALSQMLDLIEESGVLDQIIYSTFFLLQPVWLQEIFEYFITIIFQFNTNQQQKKKLALKALCFSLVQGNYTIKVKIKF